MPSRHGQGQLFPTSTMLEGQNAYYEFNLSVQEVYYYYYYGCLLSQAFLPGTSLEPAGIPTAQASSFTLQYFPYCV
jgi:hypothetical protein